MITMRPSPLPRSNIFSPAFNCAKFEHAIDDGFGSRIVGRELLACRLRLLGNSSAGNRTAIEKYS